VPTFVVWFLAAALYALPEGYAPPTPDAAQQGRIERAMGDLRGQDLQRRERAARDLALIGEPALPTVVARLNQAGSSERALLLTAVARLSAARSLLDQAKRDPDPAVRAAASPPQREPVGLARLAARYIDLVAMTRSTHRKEFTGQLKGLEPGLSRSDEQYERLRERLGDERMDSAIQWEYRTMSFRFARAADAALRSGKLKPDLDDPIFVAFLGLLYDEEVAALSAVRTLVALGPKAAPALEGMLDRKRHNPRTLLRILVAAGQGARAMARDATRWPDLRFAQVEMAPRALPRDEALAFLTAALKDDSARLRRKAMEGLLALGSIPANDLLAREKEFADEEWTLALRLRWIAGEHDALLEALRSEGAKQRGALRVLRRIDPAERSALFPPMLRGESMERRWLAVDYMTDPKALVAFAETGRDAALRMRAVRRSIQLGSIAGLALIEAPDRGLVRALRENGFVDEVVALALVDNERVADHALKELQYVDRIDPKHEARLLALYARLSDRRKPLALDALVPLGTPPVVKLLEDAGDDALGTLSARVDDGHTIPFAFGLKRLIATADAADLQRLARVGASMDKLEPGLYLAILDAWDKVEATEADVDGGSSGQKVEALRQLVRAPDVASVRELFARVLSGKIVTQNMVVPILQAATRQLPPDELAALVPKLMANIKLDYPDASGSPPEPNPPRAYFVWFSMRALAYRQVQAGLEPLVRVMLDPHLQRERYDEQSGRNLPDDWPRQARAALRHYSAAQVRVAMSNVIAEMERSGELAELSPVHLFRLLSGWRSNARRGRRLHAFALALCDLLDRLPYEGETGVARMLATGAQGRYAEAAAVGRAAAARIRQRGFDPADDRWSPRLIEGRAAIYDALARRKIPESIEKLGGDPYLLWIAGIYLRFIIGDSGAAAAPTIESVKGSAWLDRDARNLRADLLTVAGNGPAARELLQPRTRLPLEIRQGEGWYRFYLARALAGAGREVRARGELADSLRINRRLVQTAKADPLMKGYAEVFRQTEEDFFDWLFN